MTNGCNISLKPIFIWDTLYVHMRLLLRTDTRYKLLRTTTVCLRSVSVIMCCCYFLCLTSRLTNKTKKFSYCLSPNKLWCKDFPSSTYIFIQTFILWFLSPFETCFYDGATFLADDSNFLTIFFLYCGKWMEGKETKTIIDNIHNNFAFHTVGSRQKCAQPYWL